MKVRKMLVRVAGNQPRFNPIPSDSKASSVIAVQFCLYRYRNISYRIWGSHSGHCQEFRLLRYNAVYSGRNTPSFRRSVLPPSSGSKCKSSKKPARSTRQEERTACIFLHHKDITRQRFNGLMSIFGLYSNTSPECLSFVCLSPRDMPFFFQFSSIPVYLPANSTTQGPITKWARVKERKQTYTKYKTMQNNNYNFEIIIMIMSIMIVIIILITIIIITKFKY
jgi:hypothetical protein